MRNNKVNQCLTKFCMVHRLLKHFFLDSLLIKPQKNISINLIILTKCWLAVQDFEVVVHACSQKKALIGWMPLEPPHSTPHKTVSKRFPHVPAIPEQDLLIIAADRGKISLYVMTEINSATGQHEDEPKYRSLNPPWLATFTSSNKKAKNW